MDGISCPISSVDDLSWWKWCKSLAFMLLAANFAKTKWCKKWQKPWHIGTHVRVLSESYPMDASCWKSHINQFLPSLPLSYDASCWKPQKNPSFPLLYDASCGKSHKNNSFSPFVIWCKLLKATKKILLSLCHMMQAVESHIKQFLLSLCHRMQAVESHIKTNSFLLSLRHII